jgi:hypothetical protein
MDKPIRMNLQFFAEGDQTETEENTPVDSNSEDKPIEEFDIITYNKEEVKIPVSERQSYLQKGYNYDKINTKYEELKSDPRLAFIDELANNYGFNSTDEYMQAVREQQEKDRLDELIQQNIPEDIAKEILENKKFREQYEERQQYEERTQQMVSEFNELSEAVKEINQAEDIPPKVWELKEQKGISLLDAYNRIRINDLINNQEQLKKETEQETINKIMQNKNTPGALGEGGVEHNSKWSAMSDEDFAKQVELAKQGLL